MPKKAFTLIEILLVITIMAILAIAAFSSYVNTQRQFSYLNVYKQIFSTMDTARVYAITNRTVLKNGDPEAKVPESYSISLTTSIINVNANWPDTSQTLITTFTLPDQYRIQFEARYQNATSKFILGYKPTSAKFTMTENNINISSPLLIRLDDSRNPDLNRYLAIIPPTGIVETFNNITDLQVIKSRVTNTDFAN